MPDAPVTTNLSGDARRTLESYLEIYEHRQTYYDGSLMNIVLAIVGGNGALFAAFAVLDRDKFGAIVSLLGLVSALISWIAIANSRRQLRVAEERGYRVQQLLNTDIPEHEKVDPFRSPNVMRSGFKTPGPIAAIAGVVWFFMWATHSPFVARVMHDLAPSWF